MRHYNKRDKTSNLLFKVVEYGAIAFGINALLPGSPLTPESVVLGLGILSLLFVLALAVTPEKEDNSNE